MIYAQGYTTHQGLKITNPAGPSNVITLNPPSSITSYTLTLPSAAGTNGQALVTDGSGNLSWATHLSGSGTATQVAFWSGSSTLSSNANLYWDNTNSRLGIGTASPSKPLEIQASISGSSLMYLRNNSASGYSSIDYLNSSGTIMGNVGYAGASAANFAGAMYINSSAGTDLAFGGGDAERMRLKSSGALIIGGTSTSGNNEGLEIRNNHAALSNSDNTARELRFYEPSSSGSNYTSFKAPAQSADITYTLPASLPPGAGYLLSSSTTGGLSWTSPLSLGDMIRFARKTANEAISSTTIQTDDHISFSLGANEIWEIDGVLDMDCSSTSVGGIKLSFDAPTGSTLNCHVFILAGYNSSTTDEIRLLLDTPGTALGWSAVKSNNAVYLKGIVTTSSTSGTLQLNWALNSSGATTTVKTNSYVKLLRIQ